MSLPESSNVPGNLSGYYKQFGLEPGAAMRDVESAYWRVAADLRGQAAMAAYNEAYEALVQSVSPRAAAAPDEPPEAEEAIVETAEPVVRPDSKFGWPSN